MKIYLSLNIFVSEYLHVHKYDDTHVAITYIQGIRLERKAKTYRLFLLRIKHTLY